MRVFEVDHPATQDYKRRVRAAPDGVTFVPVDFARDPLAGALGRAGFDASRPAFVSWLGVTVYLDETAIEATVSVLGGFAPGSEIVVDYMVPAGLRDAAGQTYAELVGQFAAERGEPWLSVFTPEAMAALLARHGFGPARDVGQHDMIPAAAWDRADSLRPAELSDRARGDSLARGGPGGSGVPGHRELQPVAGAETTDRSARRVYDRARSGVVRARYPVQGSVHQRGASGTGLPPVPAWAAPKNR